MHDAGLVRGIDVEGRGKRKDGITLILIIRSDGLRLAIGCGDQPAVPEAGRACGAQRSIPIG